jgi:tetratricopeptide (TPR) repeat protein
LLQDHLGRVEEAEGAYQRAIELNSRYVAAWNGIGNLYCDHFQRYSDAASAFSTALEIDPLNEGTHQYIVFLHRDLLGDIHTAKQAFQSLRTKQHHKYKDTFHLQVALFAAYDANWGLCCEDLLSAIEAVGHRFPLRTADDWFRASAVLLHLNYGEELLAFLRQRGDDARMRPWYEALSALQRGDRRYLQNIPVEVRTTAEYYFDQIEKRLNALPEKTRRRPAPKPPKKRRKA